jgi:hypothetical protein
MTVTMGTRSPSLRKMKKKKGRGTCKCECERERGSELTGAGGDRGHGAVLSTGGLEDEVREWLGSACSLGRSVASKIVEGGWEDGTHVEFSCKVDYMNR